MAVWDGEVFTGMIRQAAQGKEHEGITADERVGGRAAVDQGDARENDDSDCRSTNWFVDYYLMSNRWMNGKHG